MKAQILSVFLIACFTFGDTKIVFKENNIIKCIASASAEIVENTFQGVTRVIYNKILPESVYVANAIIDQVSSNSILNFQPCMSYTAELQYHYNNLMVIAMDSADLVQVLNMSCIKNHKHPRKVLMSILVPDCEQKCLLAVANQCLKFSFLHVRIITAHHSNRCNVLFHSYFPYSDADSCDKITKVSYISKWKPGASKLNNGGGWKVKNFNQCPLKIGTFHQPPYLYIENADKENVSYYGIEANIIRSMAKVYNFSIKIRVAKDKWDGLIKSLNKEEISFISSPMLIHGDRLRNFSFLEYYKIYIHCIFPATRPTQEWLKIVKPFDGFLWYMIIISLAVLLVVNSLTNLIFFMMKDSGTDELIMDLNLADFIGILVGNSIVFNNVKYYPRYMLLVFLTFTFIIRSAYQASLMNSIMNDVTEIKLNTINDVIDEELPFGGEELLKSQFEDNQIAYNKYIVIPRIKINDYILNISDGRSFALVAQMEEIRDALETQNKSLSSVSFLKQIIGSNALGSLFPKTSNLNEMFSAVYKNLETHGLISKWLRDGVKPAPSRKSLASNEPTVLKMKHFSGAYFILGNGLLFSLLTFFVELLRTYIKNKKQ